MCEQTNECFATQTLFPFPNEPKGNWCKGKQSTRLVSECISSPFLLLTRLTNDPHILSSISPGVKSANLCCQRVRHPFSSVLPSPLMLWEKQGKSVCSRLRRKDWGSSCLSGCHFLPHCSGGRVPREASGKIITHENKDEWEIVLYIKRLASLTAGCDVLQHCYSRRHLYFSSHHPSHFLLM